MKALKALIGLAVLGGFGYAAWTLRANEGQFPWEGPKTVTVTVPAGTAIELVMLESLDAGGSKIGEEVELAVAEDVVVEGRVVLARGTRATAVVSQSRGASLFAALGNQPARLAMTLGEIKLEDGRTVALTTAGGAPVHEFTQANTADRVDAAKLARLWQEPKSKAALTEIAKASILGQPLAIEGEDLATVSKSLGLEKTTALAQSPAQGVGGLTLGKTLDAMTAGSAAGLAGADAVLAAQAIGELAELAGSVDHKLRGVFKARTVRAPIGTPVAAQTAGPFSVTLPADPPRK